MQIVLMRRGQPSEYRRQLEAKIDGVAALERSGYGATYRAGKRAERGEMYKAAAALVAFIGVIGLAAAIV